MGQGIKYADSNYCRGPEQLARGQADRSGAAPISEAGRKMLTDLMREGLGDHVLLLRLYQVSCLCMRGLSRAEKSGPVRWNPCGPDGVRLGKCSLLAANSSVARWRCWHWIRC
jgi:hypothetical protein